MESDNDFSLRNPAPAPKAVAAPVAKSGSFPFKEHSVLEHDSPVLAVRFNAEGKYCMTGTKDKTVHLWNPHKGLHIKEFTGVHGYEVLDLQISEDNSKFASCGGDRTVFYWDVTQARVLRRFQGHTHRVNCLHFNRQQGCTVLFSGSYDNTLKAWDIRSNMRDPIQNFTEFKDSVTDVFVTEFEVVASSVDGCIRSYDLRMGRMTTDHICQPITSLRVSNDQNCVLVSCLDSSVRLMDRASGELLGEYKGHKHDQYMLESCLTGFDAQVVSGSENGEVLIWDLVSANVLHTLRGHEKAVVSLDYHPTEACLLTASVDCNVKVWTD